MAAHTLYLIEANQDARAAAFAEKISASLETLNIAPDRYPGFVRLRPGDAPPTGATDDDIAFYFASAAGKSSAGCAIHIRALLSARTPVIPVLSNGELFPDVVPADLDPINALFHAVGDLQPVANFALRSLGLTENQRRVFVSYRRTEALRMGEQLWESLGKAGFDVFLDRFSIDPGRDFQRDLEQRLREKAFVLLIESPDLNRSRWVKHEVDFALKSRLGILALTWQETAHARTYVEGVLDGWRYLLTASDYRVSCQQGRFTRSFLDVLPAKVEQAHGVALQGRRVDLFGSVRAALETRALPHRTIGAWTVLVKLPPVTAWAPTKLVAISVTPRPPEIPDLFVLDNFRVRSDPWCDEAHLVHAATLDHDVLDHLHWAVNGRGLHLTSEDDIYGLIANL